MRSSFTKSRRTIFSLMFFIGLSTLVSIRGLRAQPSDEIYMIQLDDDTINPVTAEYIAQSIDQATADEAQCLVIKMDTPGGLLTSTRQIVKKILSSRVPVIVYIAPSGSRAGSAGVFITYASHVAAMAPSTNIGAAHPVSIGQQGKARDIWDELKELMDKKRSRRATSGENQGGAGEPAAGPNMKAQETTEKAPGDTEDIREDTNPMNSKILKDSVAFIRSLAVKRGRNVTWAVKSVAESSSVTETEALELGVVDLIARSDQDLFEKLDGRVVKMDDRDVTLQTKDAPVKRVAMNTRQQFFNILANPNIAYILMILGFYGLLYEITHPGFGFPGILGTIFLILAFFSMQTLPTNYAGLALVLLGVIFFIAEAAVPGWGLFTFGGVVCMVLGSLLLFDSSVPALRVSLSLILAFTATTAFITIFLVGRVIHTHRMKVMSGQEGMLGEEGEVVEAITPQRPGKVFVHGVLWNASAGEDLAKGEKVVVEHIRGIKIRVKKI